MPIHNLLEYINNCSKTPGSLSNYYRDKVNDNANENNTHNYRTNNKNTITSKSFEYKAKLITNREHTKW